MCSCLVDDVQMFKRMNAVRGGENVVCFFFSLFLFLLVFFCARELASLETQFRLVQAVRPRGAGRDEGPASLPVLITKRQEAHRQINGKGLSTNAGHAW